MKEYAKKVGKRVMMERRNGDDREKSQDIKEEFDLKYGQEWTCTIGVGFKSSYSFQHSIHMSVGIKEILLYKCNLDPKVKVIHCDMTDEKMKEHAIKIAKLAWMEAKVK